MEYWLRRQTPEKQFVDALLLVASCREPARLAGGVLLRMTRHDAGAVADSLRYLAALLDVQGATAP